MEWLAGILRGLAPAVLTALLGALGDGCALGGAVSEAGARARVAVVGVRVPGPSASSSNSPAQRP